MQVEYVVIVRKPSLCHVVTATAAPRVGDTICIHSTGTPLDRCWQVTEVLHSIEETETTSIEVYVRPQRSWRDWWLKHIRLPFARWWHHLWRRDDRGS